MVNNGPWETCSLVNVFHIFLNTQLVPLPNNHHLPEMQKIEIYQDLFCKQMKAPQGVNSGKGRGWKNAQGNQCHFCFLSGCPRRQRG